MRGCSTVLFLLLCFLSRSMAAQTVQVGGAGLKPIELRISGLKDPVGLDQEQPHFGWQLQASDAGAHNLTQSAYRILVASSLASLRKERPDIWDSGRTESQNYTHVSFAGKALQSHTTYFWKVCVWEGAGRQQACSAVSRWTTSLFHPDEWSAKWIAAKPDRPLEPQAREGGGDKHQAPETLPLFRRSIEVAKPVKQALVYVSGLGQYELHLNGRSVTDAIMTPGWTNYRKRVLYNTYDVTDQIRKGKNTLGVMLGNGMYNVAGLEGRYTKFIGSFGNPKLILQMHITFADGSVQVVVTDRTWQTTPGPIVLSSVYGGEDYDARKEVRGWDIDARSSVWSDAFEVSAPSGSKNPGDSLASTLVPPMRVVEVIKPVRQSVSRPSGYVYDLGKNFSGWPNIQIKGRAGDVVRLLPGELLDSNGDVSQKSASASKSNPVLFTYTLRGDGIESWHPRFSYYGFRYVQVEIVAADKAGPPMILSVVGDFIHDDVAVNGYFSSEVPLLNNIHHLIDEAIQSNLASILTDCPTREKLGWLEQTYLNGSSVMYNYGVAHLYGKISDDMAEAQTPDGMIPGIAPEYVAFVDKNAESTAFRDSPEWGSAVILSPWEAYRFYGDVRTLGSHYEAMVRYVAYLQSRSVNGLLNFGLGDWYDIGPREPGPSQLTSKALTATAIYYQDLATLAHIATLLNKPADAQIYTNEAASLKTTLNRALYHSETRTYDRGSQTANAMALYLGFVPEQDREAVLTNLVGDIRSHNNHVTAGDIGFHYVVGALLRFGRSDVLYDIVSRTDSPSYGYQLTRGATSLTEAWDTNPGSSQNHFMLGHAEEWFYRGLAGIDIDLSRTDAEQISLRPALDSGAPGATATLTTVFGTVSSSWHRNRKDWTAEFTIPAGSRATLALPVGATPVGEQTRGSVIDRAELPESSSRTERWLVGSGIYEFKGPI